MSQSKMLPITADDPELTAFALGELEATDAVRYAEAVAASAELRGIVAEIQAEARILSDELRLEPVIPLTAERQAEIIAHVRQPSATAAVRRKPFAGLTRRATVVAASMLMVPGAWYAFQAAVARREPATDEFSTAASQRPLMASVEPKFRGRPISAVANGGLAPQMEATPATAFRTGRDSGRFDQQSSVAGSHPISLRQGDVNDVSGVSRVVATATPSLRKEDLRNEAREAGLEVSAAHDYPEATTTQPSLPAATPGTSAPQDGIATLAIPVATSKPGQTPDEFARDSEGRAKGKKVAKPQAALSPLGEQQAALPEIHEPFPAPQPHQPVNEALSAAQPKPAAATARPTPRMTTLSSEAKESARPYPIDTYSDRQVALTEAAGSKADPTKGPAAAELAPLGWAKREIPWNEDPNSNEAYAPIYENLFINSATEQLSTFSIDVDTASYANVRRFLQGGQLPPPNAVRIEELVNYFAYQYPQPQDGRPFSVQTDIATCPWQPEHQLVRVGLKGKEIPKEQRTPTNLVFLVDVSGSMDSPNKLPLVRESLKTLVAQLDERDKVAIVTYAGQAGIPLQSTSVAQRETIIAAINSLGAGGSTNGAAGINTAYDIAAQGFLDKGANRVILCTDGDFNVGVTSREGLEQMIKTRATGGVFLSIFGFGMGNLKDATLEQLADKGNGVYGYIDDQQEANKVFVEEMMGTLVTIAKDVKIQVDFNPQAVASYRLVGYENRVMAAADFHNDKKDAGEIGAGHTVTALYEIIPAKDLKVDDTTRWLTVKLRYKQPEASESVLFENPLVGPAGQLKAASSDFQFASSVAAAGMLLRHSQFAGQANWALVKELAQSGLSYDPHGHRRGFLGLVSQAESLMGQLHPASPPAPESTVRGKYKSLLRKLNAPGDTEKYGQFNDYGYADTKSYAGSDNLPAGYWVYIAPHWYIWAETTQPDAKKPE